MKQLTGKLLIIVFLTFGSVATFADGLLVEHSHTVEEARISVDSKTETSGVLTASLLECDNCSANEYSYDGSTVFLNQFGARKAIEELPKWSGSRAMFHFRLADKHIEQLQILP